MTETLETRIETYIPLYRKYRPQSFADLAGQEAIVQTLGNAIQLNKVAHAYLFCGPRGTGKTSTARIFAKSLNCEQGPTVTPCMQCASCTGIAQGNALDVIEFDAASNNGVDDARELIENCQYSSMSGRFKVYIIDEVHMLTTAAFNALLKTLEEPPANVIFIFATTEAHKVLPTIISRCQRFDFNRITTDTMISRLRFIAQQEQIRIDEDALLMIARHARGGLRDAVGLLDQVSVLARAQQDKIIGAKDVALFIGALEEDILLRLSQAIAHRQVANLLQELNALLNRGIEPIQLLKDLTVHFRNLLLVQAAGPQATPEALVLPADYYQQLQAQTAWFSAAEELPQIIGRLSVTERNVRNSPQPQLWLEVGLIELAYRTEIHLVHDLAERLAQLEARVNASPAAPLPTAAPAMANTSRPPIPSGPSTPLSAPAASTFSQTSAPPPSVSNTKSTAASAPVTPQPVATATSISETPIPTAPPASSGSASSSSLASSLDGLYTQMCASIPSLMLRSLLQQQAFAYSVSDDLLTIGCSGEAILSAIKKGSNLAHLQRAVDKVWNRPMRLDFMIEKRPASGTAAHAANALPSEPSATAAVPREMAPPSPPPLTISSSHPEPPVESLQPATASSLQHPPDADDPVITHAAEAPAAFTAPPQFIAPIAPSASIAPTALEDEETPLDTGMPSASNPDELPAMAIVGGDPALGEAKKHTLELLQGRVLE